MSVNLFITNQLEVIDYVLCSLEQFFTSSEYWVGK